MNTPEKDVRFKLKQLVKMYVHNVHLPHVYKEACRKCTVDPKKIIFADMHEDGLPNSMRSVYISLKRQGYKPVVLCRDIGKMSRVKALRFMGYFMKEYASAGTVFISTYFLPVSSAKKRPETKVVQLWHSGGLLKKMGYDTEDDIPKGYHGAVTANYDLVTVSAPVCENIWESALRLKPGTAQALGLARTDIYFDDKNNKENIDTFFRLVPEAKGKKIVLYVPSFSGNAARARCAGIECMSRSELESRLGDEYYVIYRPHPNLRKDYPVYFEGKDNSMDTSQLLSVADVLITDYSSILFDYSIYKKPFVLFCPDIEDYKKNRGFYADPYTFPCEVTTDVDGLVRAVKEVFTEKSADEIAENKKLLEEFYQKYMGNCDGHSTERILSCAMKM